MKPLYVLTENHSKFY